MSSSDKRSRQNRFGKVQLERALSKLGLASRSQTKEWISAGRLKVNGMVVRDALRLVTPERDKFSLDDVLLEKKSFQTIILYKPRGVVTTRSDEHGRRTVYELLPPELKHLHPVGRLDMASTGLLVMTNDTKLSSYLTDPANAIERTYVVTVTGRVTPEEVAKAAGGILDDGEILKPTKISLRKASGKESHLTVELTEGKNREIRRIFLSLGHEVTHLKRIAFGSLKLNDLESGKFRVVTNAEIRKL